MILRTNSIITLIQQDKSLYGKGLEKLDDPALAKIIKDRFKVCDLAIDMDKTRAELAKHPRPQQDSILLYNAVVLLLERKGKRQLADELGCSVAKIDKILEGK